jgi:hypothetical protein
MSQNISFDLYRTIFSFLGGAEDSRIPKDYLIACTSVCKRWQEALEDRLWERIRKQHLYTFTPVPGCGSLKEQCLQRLKGIAERLLQMRFEQRAFLVRNPDSCAFYHSCSTMRWRDKLLVQFNAGIALYPHRRKGEEGDVVWEHFFPLKDGQLTSHVFVQQDKLFAICNFWGKAEILVWDLPSRALVDQFSYPMSRNDFLSDRWLESTGQEIIRVQHDTLILIDFSGAKREKQFTDHCITAVHVAPDNHLFVALQGDLSPFPVLEQLNLKTLETERVINVKGFAGIAKITQLLTFQDRLFAASAKSALIEIDIRSLDPNPSCFPIQSSKEIDRANNLDKGEERIHTTSSWILFGSYALESNGKFFRVYNLEMRAHVASRPTPSKYYRGFNFAHGEWSQVGNGFAIIPGATHCTFYDFNPPLPVPPPPVAEEPSCWSRFWTCITQMFAWVLKLFE